MRILFLGIFLTVAACAVLDAYINENFFVYIAMIILILVAGLRSIDTGFDTFQYYYDYNNVVAGFTPINSKEKGFILLEKLIASLNLPVWCFFIFIASLTICLIVFGYRKLTPYPGLALLYYYSRFYIGRDLNQIRASLASAILLFSIKYIYQQKLMKFLLIVLIATLVHSGACIALFLYPFYLLYKKVKDTYKVKLYITLIIVSVFSSFLLSPYIGRLNGKRIAAYTQSKMYISGNGIKNPVILLQVVLSVIALFIFLRKHSETGQYFFNATLFVYMYSTILLIIFSQYYTLAGRMSTFFATVEPIVFIYVLMNCFSRKNIFRVSMILVCLIIFILINYSTGLVSEINYSFYLTK